jgi:hypothetical protein
MRPRPQRGAPCGGMVRPGDGRWRLGRSPAETGSLLGRRTFGSRLAGPAEASPLDHGSASRHRFRGRPRPDQSTGTNERWVTEGSAEAGPGVTDRRSRTSVRPRPDGGTGSPCLGADEGRQAPAPNGKVRTSLPRGGDRSWPTHRRVPRRNARRRTGAAGTRAGPCPAEAGRGRSRRTLRGAEGPDPGGCEGTIPGGW